MIAFVHSHEHIKQNYDATLKKDQRRAAWTWEFEKYAALFRDYTKKSRWTDT